MRLLTLVIFAVCLAAFAIAKAPPFHQVLILGDSLTEGYGVAKEDAFPALLEKSLQNDGFKNVRIINGGASGSTSASGLSRLRWSLKLKPDILILALGANDGLRGLSPDETQKNLQEIIEFSKKNGLTVLLAGMKAPPNYGREYAKKFEGVFSAVAQQEKIQQIPFLLVGVAGEPSLNQADGIHPNEKGHRQIALTIKKFLKPLLLSGGKP